MWLQDLWFLVSEWGGSCLVGDLFENTDQYNLSQDVPKQDDAWILNLCKWKHQVLHPSFEEHNQSICKPPDPLC